MKSCLPPGVRGCECMSQASEAGVCVSYQCRLIFVYRGWMGGGGGGGEDAVHISWLMNSSKHRWT